MVFLRCPHDELSRPVSPFDVGGIRYSAQRKRRVRPIRDMGFWFQTLCCADSMMFTNEPFYEYRQDDVERLHGRATKQLSARWMNMRFIHQFLERYPAIEKAAMPIFYHRKFGSSLFSYGRAELSLRLPFLRQRGCGISGRSGAGRIRLRAVQRQRTRAARAYHGGSRRVLSPELGRGRFGREAALGRGGRPPFAFNSRGCRRTSKMKLHGLRVR